MHMTQRDGALDLLKWLALLSMVLDHLRYVGYSIDILFAPGRLAFPWFCLAMAENLDRAGARQTEWRYLGWLLLFSLISEIPYRLYIPDPDISQVIEQHAQQRQPLEQIECAVALAQVHNRLASL